VDRGNDGFNHRIRNDGRQALPRQVAKAGSLADGHARLSHKARVIEVAWRIHVRPRWEHRVLGEIRHSEVQARVSDLSAKKSPTVVIRAFGILAGIIDVAVKDRRLPSNPARGVNLPRKRREKEPHYLSHTQVQLLADESRANGTLVLLLAYTGLRWGEAVGLRVSNVDFARRGSCSCQRSQCLGKHNSRHSEIARASERSVSRIPR
jgi:integrase